MRNRLLTILLAVMVLFIGIDLFAESSRKKYFMNPQVGIWYGPVTPLFDTSDLINPDMGVGLFFRYNLPVDLLKIGIDTSYQNYTSDGINELTMVPLYMNMLYLIPIDIPVRLQYKLGAGSAYLFMEPDEISQWEPLFMTGFEVSFPAGKVANIALRLDYLFVYEEYMENAKENGHFFHAAIALYFNFNM